MKLIKHYTTKDKKYYKYEVVIPNKAIKKAGFKAGDDLKYDVEKGKVELRKK